MQRHQPACDAGLPGPLAASRVRACARALLVAALAGCGPTGGSDAHVEEGGGVVRDAAGRETRSFALPAGSQARMPSCSTAARVRDLTGGLRETSGLAASRRYPGILWTHNDSGGEPTVYALGPDGRLVGAVRVTGASNVDWEDIAIGPCPTGDCLYIGDLGDNDQRRSNLVIYRVPEPAPGARATAPAERLRIGYPDGPRDAEALYVLPDTSIWIVTKGRRGPVQLYRFPGRPRPGSVATLTLAQTLSPEAERVTLDALVTAADATPDGRTVAIRTYAWLQLYRVGAQGRLTALLPPPGIGLEDANEPQGEGLAFGQGGTIWLSSESGPLGAAGSLSRLGCRF